MSQKDFINYYKEYKDKIYNYFWYRVNFDQVRAEDLTSEVFLKALSNFEKFDPNGSFQAWIYTIAKNHFLNYCRVAYREISLDQAEQIKVDNIKKIEAGLEMEKVVSAIGELDDYYKEVLLLKFVDGLDNQEIAEMLDKEEGAIRTQLSRALAVLRSKIKYD